MLPNITKLQINDALYSNRSSRNLLSFKDILQNGYHIEISNEGSSEFFCITLNISCQKHVLEKLLLFLLVVLYNYKNNRNKFYNEPEVL